MATTIQAAQVSTNTSSWYQKLRKIQAKTNQYFGTTSKMTQTTDPAITAGSKATATQMNAFLTALNGVQSNEFLGYADWTKKVSSVTAGAKISSTVKSNIDTVITSLQAICSQYGTNDTYTEEQLSYYVCSDYQTYSEDSYYGNYDQSCQTVDDSHTGYSTWSYNNDCGDYSHDGTWAEEVGESTYNNWSDNSTYGDYPGEDNSTNWYDHGTYSESPYATEGPGNQEYTFTSAAGESISDGEKSNAGDSNDSTWSYDGWDYNHCTDCTTYGYESFNATAEYTRSAESCDNCDYWDYGNSTYDVEYGGNTTYWQWTEACTENSYNSTNSVEISYYTWDEVYEYGTYTVTGNSVYSN